MSILRSPEVRGILGIFLVIVVVGAGLALATGKFEQWFGISLFSGPKILDKIIYVSGAPGSGDLYSMAPDGSDRARLTEGMHVFSTPAISPLGNRVLCVGRFDRQDQVFAVGARGGTPDRLTSATGPKRLPAYSPDGKKLSFIASGKVYTAEPNGDGLDPVLPTEESVRAAMADPLGRNQSPAYTDYRWQRDSSGMIGLTRDAAESDILVYLPKLHGAEASILPPREIVNQLLADSGMVSMRIPPSERVRVSGACWAAEDDVLAVSVVARKSSFLMVFTMQDGKLSLAGFRPFEDQELGRPALTPDGSELVVPVRSSGKSTSDGLLRVDLQSGSTGIVVGGLFENPSYSPDGGTVLATIVGEDGKTRDVVAIDLESGEMKQLTNDGHSHDAIWTPASEK